MGIYIKDMRMPETCKLCYLSEFDPGFHGYICKPTRIWIDCDVAKIDRPRTICPLVPVPAHGRLGDLDELYASLKKWLIQNRHSMTEATRVWIRGVLEGIDAAPTIIPAEEGE